MVAEYTAHPYDVLILGGGVAGLSAAVAVAQAGLVPLVLEAANKPGGRARSFYDREFAETLDNGPHLFIGAYHGVFKLLETLGTADRFYRPPSVDYQFWSRQANWYRLRCPNWPAPLHLLAGVSGFLPLSWRERLTALRLGPALLADRTTLEEQTVSQWLHGHGQGGAVFEQLWAPLCLAALNEPAGSANAALFAEVLSRSFFRDRQAATPLLPTLPLSKLIAEPARKFIEDRGGRLLSGQRVKKIIQTGREVVGVTTGQWSFSKPQAIITALPYDALSKLMPEWADKVGFSRLSSAPIVSVHLSYDRPARLPAALIGLPFETSQWLFDRNIQHDRQGTDQGARLSVVMSGAYREVHWTKNRLLTTVTADIERLQPGLSQASLLGARVIKERRATFSPWPQSSRQRPQTVTPWQNMAVAGDWTATNLPATLEGAVMSGDKAARKVLAFLAVDR
jgi:hydroxysqualene dehydroxylase